MKIKFWIRDEKIIKSFDNFIVKNKLELVKYGWDIGKRGISLLKDSVSISIIPDSGIPCVEISFIFNVSDNIKEDINKNIDLMKNVLINFLRYIPKAKITMNISYSVSKYLYMSLDEIIKDLLENEFEENKMIKLMFRKFEYMKGRYVTTNITLKEDKDSVVLDFGVNIENIIVVIDSILGELENSVYFYHYHYNYLLPFRSDK